MNGPNIISGTFDELGFGYEELFDGNMFVGAYIQTTGPAVTLDVDSISVLRIPEPASLVLLGLGGAMLLLCGKWRRPKSASS